jgi:hypothetical protein
MKRVRHRIEQLEAAAASRLSKVSTKDETAAFFEYLKKTALTDRPAYRHLVIEAAKQSREYAEDMVTVGSAITKRSMRTAIFGTRCRTFTSTWE